MHRDLRLELAAVQTFARGVDEAGALLARLDDPAGVDAGAGAGHARLAARLRDVDAELEAARQRLRADLAALLTGGAAICRDFAAADADLAGAHARLGSTGRAADLAGRIPGGDGARR